MTSLSLLAITGPIFPAGARGTSVPLDPPKKGLSTGAKAGIGAGALASRLCQLRSCREGQRDERPKV
ncbi:hypothetical protein HBI17_002000 [Parastagonospora nodorum]|nr:hypothetical protein HBH96_042600 [Parastagonospora nodorum]KAH5125486.1 hypothetical protein HBH71_007430 [Parastagonospora nodorum]KAH5659172.1 hypothetical protein HBI51_007500 [Parastagonospora nodorum]KAH5774138.1 hypothetical protein HBI17_002000 [Parastagonospora nodorum]KAH6006700.1 hypothetical protein HBI84_064800 [Parastagonospora nodorum]